MKNIHILPTNNQYKGSISLTPDGRLSTNVLIGIPQNIYVTSYEDIKDGDWFLLDMSHSSHPNEVHQMGHNKWSKTGGINFSEPNSWTKACKKIILTTDANLIKNGVQSIDDEFLVWFVNNPSCEEVEVKPLLSNNGRVLFSYKIIIPKEEPKSSCPKCRTTDFDNCHSIHCPIRKQECKDCNKSLEDCTCIEDTIDIKEETLEESAEMYIQSKNPQWTPYHKQSFKDGAKWQSERMYSEEDLKEAYFSAISSTGEGWNAEYANGNNPNIEEKFSKGFAQWFEQYKKK